MPSRDEWETKLIRCPFCKSRAFLVPSSPPPSAVARCTSNDAGSDSCTARVVSEVGFEDAVKKWNRRD